VVCRPKCFYRVEAVVACRLEGAPDSGVFLAVGAADSGGRGDEWRVSPALLRSTEPVTMRTYYRTAEGCRRLQVGVRLAGASGSAAIQEVRVILILEPDEASHMLAFPAPPHALRASRPCRSVCVCSERAESRAVTGLLRQCLGEGNVRAVGAGTLEPGGDAVLLPDAVAPAAIRSLSALVRLAEERVVVISLPAFRGLAGQSLSLRRIEQPDDPIHAKVVFSNYVTGGFALHDVFAYAWPGRKPGSFAQNQFRKTPKFDAFCKRHGLTALLASMCDKDATSDQPICLFRELDGGALFVLDIDPAEAVSSTFGETSLAMQFLLGVLGHRYTGPGQYVVPHRREEEFRGGLLDLADRSPAFVVRGPDVPVDETHEQLVTIGDDDQSFGLPLRPKPMILIRSGLTSGDVESVYAAQLWLKQLIRTPPHESPYAAALASQFRFAWVPLAAEWDSRDGWARCGRRPAHPMTLELEDSAVAAVIDVVSLPCNRVRVVIPEAGPAYARCVAWLPRLFEAFGPAGYFAATVPDGEPFGDRDRIGWRRLEHAVQLEPDRDLFDEPIHADASRAGGRLLRLELPGSDADFTAMSIHRTGVALTLLEHVIGLQYGLVAVNRRATPVHFDGFPTVKPGQALIVHADDAMLRSSSAQTG